MRIDRRTLLGYAVMAPFIAVQESMPELQASQLGQVEYCAIYPPVGFSRIGNSTESYYLSPEVPGVPSWPSTGIKDGAGRILPQVCRFRVYAFNSAGRVIGEVNANNAKVTWHVHVANRKSAWYDFDQALDIPESVGLGSKRRNAEVVDRGSLVIDPGERCITGQDVNCGGERPEFRFDSGTIWGKPVDLGHLRTDEKGRLLVFGGSGLSASRKPGTPAYTFANNDGWHDDTSDGPVDAVVRIGGREFRAEGAWVVTGPPNYAPGIAGIVTLYDVMYDVALGLGVQAPARPSFTRQIFPLLQRSVQYQWTNQGSLQDNGWGSDADYTRPELLRKLANPSRRYKDLRMSVFAMFRNPDPSVYEPDKLPPCYGDAISRPAVSGRQYQSVLDSQYGWLAQWAEGDFVSDLPHRLEPLKASTKLEQLPMAEQPDALTRAALDDCLGGPFHPGCELTWPVRQPLLYAAPFRIARRMGPEADFGAVLTPEIALAPNGPLHGSGPGDLSRWMAVPWQTDTSSCLYGYFPGEIYLPTFWPARVPNQVLATSDYEMVMNKSLSLKERQAAFARRTEWFRSRPTTTAQSIAMINKFIHEWSRIGVVMPKPGPGGKNFPDQFWVEQDADFS